MMEMTNTIKTRKVLISPLQKETLEFIPIELSKASNLYIATAIS